MWGWRGYWKEELREENPANFWVIPNGLERVGTSQESSEHSFRPNPFELVGVTPKPVWTPGVQTGFAPPNPLKWIWRANPVWTPAAGPAGVQTGFARLNAFQCIWGSKHGMNFFIFFSKKGKKQKQQHFSGFSPSWFHHVPFILDIISLCLLPNLPMFFPIANLFLPLTIMLWSPGWRQRRFCLPLFWKNLFSLQHMSPLRQQGKK